MSLLRQRPGLTFIRHIVEAHIFRDASDGVYLRMFGATGANDRNGTYCKYPKIKQTVVCYIHNQHLPSMPCISCRYVLSLSLSRALVELKSACEPNHHSRGASPDREAKSFGESIVERSKSSSAKDSRSTLASSSQKSSRAFATKLSLPVVVTDSSF